MHIVDDLSALRDAVADLRSDVNQIGFVPTMGNLHEGHLSLVDQAQRHSEAVVASIYVNPLQFGENEDFSTYPRTLDDDREALEKRGVKVLFLPRQQDIYPHGTESHTRVLVPGLSHILCGEARPIHFEGVTTVVARLLNLVSADIAVFGKKDYQQHFIIKRMVSDLALPVRIIGGETVRAPDGLALSSRNNYLTQEERAVAPILYRSLKDSAVDIERGAEREDVETRALSTLSDAGFVTDYLSVRRQSDLAEAAPDDKELVILGAARLGRTRLIDNIEVVRN